MRVSCYLGLMLAMAPSAGQSTPTGHAAPPAVRPIAANPSAPAEMARAERIWERGALADLPIKMGNGLRSCCSSYRPASSAASVTATDRA